MPAILALFIKLIPTILQLVVAVEPLFTKGADKKAAVLKTTEALIQGADTAFTGGAAETWAILKPLVNTAIDVGATIYFPHTGVMDELAKSPGGN